jgi:O6-methylguanine-DNA--protein-cysteine methyltransferase
MTTIDIAEYETPLGAATGAAQKGKLVALTFSDRWNAMEARLIRRLGSFKRRTAGGLQTRLHAYFAGDVNAFDQIEVNPGGTEFQAAVWAELRRIRPGSTTTYSALAHAIGSPKAVRRSRCGQRRQPYLAHHSLPPCDWFRRQPHWLRRRHRAQTLATRARTPLCASVVLCGSVGDPVAVKAERHAAGQMHDPDRRPADVEASRMTKSVRHGRRS